MKHRYELVIGRVLSANIKKSVVNDYLNVRTSALDYINCRSIYERSVGSPGSVG